jgi:uncharacterized protein (TIGR00299 family) protein
MRTLYFDCFSGISGDMTIGALLDLGLDFEYLKTELGKLPVEGYELKYSRTVRANISAVKFDVVIRDAHDHADHHHHHHHPHEHRKAADILATIGRSSLNTNAKRLATEIFTKLAISEGKVHHIPPEAVEFHEVGAVDSIVDTVGAAIGFDALGIERFVCSPINVGGGFIHCQHGIYPVPAPATADLLRDATIYSKHATAELVTPTGAAILAAVVNRFGVFQNFSIERVGYGSGTKDFGDFPNCLRLMVGEEREAVNAEAPGTVAVIEANIDDMTPQNFAYVTEKLLSEGALDVFTTAIQMKKGRPGHLLQVLVPQQLLSAVSKTIFRETTTIGVRYHNANRTVLDRETVAVETQYGTVGMKVSRLDGEIVNLAPEYEDCARIARQRNVPLKSVQQEAISRYTSSQAG